MEYPWFHLICLAHLVCHPATVASGRNTISPLPRSLSRDLLKRRRPPWVSCASCVLPYLSCADTMLGRVEKSRKPRDSKEYRLLKSVFINSCGFKCVPYSNCLSSGSACFIVHNIGRCGGCFASGTSYDCTYVPMGSCESLAPGVFVLADRS